MQPASTLTVLFRHNMWANLQLLEVCAGLTEEQRDATLSGTFGSINDTWQHIAVSEKSYLSRIRTGKRLQRADDAPPISMAELAVSLRATGEGFVTWAENVEAGDTVEIDWDGVMRDVPKTILLTQAINHATEHRAQMMAILTQLGIEPPELDAWAYFDAVSD